MKRDFKRLAMAAVLLALAAGAVWYVWLRGPAGTGTGQERTAKPGERDGAQSRRRGRAVNRVVVVKVSMETVGDRVAAVGTGRALRSLTLSAEVAGVIEALLFKSGEPVKAGQALVKLKSEAEEIAVKLAQVKVDEAEANLKRYETLSERNAVASVQVQQARTALALAKAELEAKQYELRRRTIVAPFDGVMGLTTLAKGDYLQPGAAIATIDDRSSLLVAFVVAERVSGSLKLGQDVRATTPALPGLVSRGSITALDTRIDAASRTLRAEATLPNAENRLIAGMTFSVEVRLPGEQLPVIPGLAIQWDRNGAYVWALGGESKVRRVGVTIRQRENDKVAVEAALKDGDQVVIEGAQGLREGAQVVLAQN
ncbi:MAG: efflux RND transporter periplasmic adaptor subunit [Rhodospirillaceae bacterium]|nr:efflux RND transporter periplasmic adaptor subunit [Rhodospirillaceae bacterium]